MTFTATPQPGNAPPRVRLDVGADDASGSFVDLVLSRDGRPVREQPFLGGSVVVGYDYEAPFGVPVTYTAKGAYLPSLTPDWVESWSTLTNWTGDGFTASGGKARSPWGGSRIVRSASGVIQRLSVADPSYMRVELLDASDVVVASIEVAGSVTVTGSSTPTTVSGSGSFLATLTGGVVTVAATNSSWSASRPYVGTPTKVRVVSLGVSYPAGLSFATASTPGALAVDSAGNIYVTQYGAASVRKFNASGTQTQVFALPTPSRGAVAVDAAGNVYVAVFESVRKFNPAGTQTLSIAVSDPRGVAVDAAGNIYVTDAATSYVRKFNPAGTQIQTFGTFTQNPTAVTVDSAGSVYILHPGLRAIRKYTSAGVALPTFYANEIPYGRASGIAVDSQGSMYVSDSENGVVRKYDGYGLQITTIPTGGRAEGVALDASETLYVGDVSNGLIRTYKAVTPSVGTIIETPQVVATKTFDASVTVTLDVPDAWLIHPSQPSLSIPIEQGVRTGRTLRYLEASSGGVKTSEAQATIHRPTGRRKAVVISSGPRQADEWTLVVGAPTISQKNAVRAIVDDQTPLLLRIPPAMLTDLPDDWYSVGAVTVSRVASPVIAEETLITLPLVPVDEPIVRRGAIWTWGDVLLKYATWGDLLAANETWMDVLAGPTS